MTIPAEASLLRLLLCGLLLAAPEAMGQTTNTKPPSPPPAHKATPVVRPHGATHPQKPPPKPPAAAPAPQPPAPPPPEPPKPTEAETAKGSNTGLPLPRFAALRSDEVNLRAGPGTRYPIEWIYKRRELPVQIQREFEVWRLVQDPDGIKGWVHQATLTGRRSFIVTGVRCDATAGRSRQRLGGGGAEAGGDRTHQVLCRRLRLVPGSGGRLPRLSQARPVLGHTAWRDGHSLRAQFHVLFMVSGNQNRQGAGVHDYPSIPRVAARHAGRDDPRRPGPRGRPRHRAEVPLSIAGLPDTPERTTRRAALRSETALAPVSPTIPVPR